MEVLIANDSVTLTGVAGTSTVGSVTIETDSTANAVGVAATGFVGNTFETQNGAVGTSAVGTVFVPQHVSITLTGVAGNSTVGTVTIVEGQGVDVNLTGVAGTSQVGNTFETQNGALGTSAVGTVSVAINTTANLTGISITPSVGTSTANGSAIITLTGVSTSTFIGSVLIWDNIIPNAGNTWSNITPSTSTSWTDIAAQDNKMSTYVNNLRLEEIGTGEASGTWGTKTNTNLELIGEALGFGTEAITTNADTHASTVADASTDQARAIYIKYTGTLDSACTITIGPNTMKRVHIIENATSGSQNIIISQGSGGNVTIANGQTKIVYLDGAGSGAAVTDALADLSIPDLFIDDDVSLQSDGAILNFGADSDINFTHTADTSLTLGGAGSTTGLIVNNTATDGDPFVAFSLSGTQKFTMGVDDGDSDKFKLGTTAIGTDTMLSIDSSKNVDIVGHNGSSVGLKLGGTLVTATAASLNNAATTGKAIAMAIVFG